MYNFDFFIFISDESQNPRIYRGSKSKYADYISVTLPDVPLKCFVVVSDKKKLETFLYVIHRYWLNIPDGVVTCPLVNTRTEEQAIRSLLEGECVVGTTHTHVNGKKIPVKWESYKLKAIYAHYGAYI